VKDVNRFRELHRVYSTICVAVVRRDDFQHGPATEATADGFPFTALDGLEQVLLVSVSSRKGGGFSDRRTERKRPKEALLSGDSKRLDETRLTGCLRSRATSGQRNRRNRP
jgi:hypothetical protein